MEAALVALAVILGLAALGCVVVLLLSFRTPRPFEPAIPNFVPDDWGGDEANRNLITSPLTVRSS